jgi:NAD(P)-dependent dehydrogenase (short-subunit alcohol dehydrogenase family)
MKLKLLVGYVMIDTARNCERGEGAVRQLEEEGLQPEFLPLDVDSEESIRTAKETVEKKYGRLDVLINNAGVLLRVSGRNLSGKKNLKEMVCLIKYTEGIPGSI